MVLQEMFCDPKFQGKWHLKFEEEAKSDGERVYGSFSSGLFFEHLQVGVAFIILPLSKNAKVPLSATLASC